MYIDTLSVRLITGLESVFFMLKKNILICLIVVGLYLYNCSSNVYIDKNVDKAKDNVAVYVRSYDSDNKPVSLAFTKKPKRIIAYHQNNIETIKNLHEEKHLVGTLGRFVTVRDEEQVEQKNFLSKVPYYGLYGINQEMAVYLQPDLILGWPSSFLGRGVWSLGRTEFWQLRDVNCYVTLQRRDDLLYETIEGEFQYLRDMGKIFNKEKEITYYINHVQNYINEVSLKYKNQHKQRVLFLDIYGNIISSYGYNRLTGDIVRKLGGELVMLSVRPSQEEILYSDPDVIFLIYKTNEEIIAKNRFLNDRKYASLRAVKNKRVYTVPLPYVYNSGWRVKDAVEIIASGLYPGI